MSLACFISDLYKYKKIDNIREKLRESLIFEIKDRSKIFKFISIYIYYNLDVYRFANSFVHFIIFFFFSCCKLYCKIRNPNGYHIDSRFSG